ncbi:MAG: electron transfer flavoprotein subunit beta/FixA family protein [Firmicutes bacterium]|nr:electron transfer flavoprotein subunit beta/FixA family protein [Bacillota bacterium]
MKIVVLIKQVPGTDNVKMNPETGTMVRTGRDNVINPLDENALEAALRIKARHPGTVITAVSMGPPSARKALKEAVALGADNGVLLSAKAFAGSDTIVTARVLAAAVRKLGEADLILCGERATDGETGQTGPMVAEMLDIPLVSYVKHMDVGEKGVLAERIVEDGFELVEVPFPCLINVVKDINEPGFPSLRGKVRARDVDLPAWGPEELGLTAEETGLTGSPTRVVKIFTPKLSRDTQFYKHDGSGKAIGALLRFLGEKEVL